jgi:ankyrin repeat protein
MPATSMVENDNLMELARAIAAGENTKTARLLAAAPDLAQARMVRGAGRSSGHNYFLEPIRVHLYAGDSALHVAAAAFNWNIIQDLLGLGADHGARNRQGAEPLHYAASANTWNPADQAASIDRLMAAGANPNAVDKNGVTPLHRAVRTRSAVAVAALLRGGAEVTRKNANGSTPLHLAVQNTGHSGSGTAQAREQQRQIILILLENGARLEYTDGKGRSVEQAISADWIRDLLMRR